MTAKVLLIGWDAADWRMINPLLEQGLMPHLKSRFVNGGVIGNAASLVPMLSPMLWTSIATGKHADKHGILGFAEPDGATGAIRPVTSTSRACKAIWNICSEHGRKAGAINWFASHPAEAVDGFVVSDRFPHPAGPPDQPWPAIAGSVHPPELLDELATLRIHPAQTTREQIRPFIMKLDELDPRKDENLHQLRVMLAQCATVHAATTHLMQTREWDFLGVYHDAIDRFGHAFMQYHPPRRPDVSEADFARFRDVMVGCYRFHDMMLGRLLELAGDDTIVIILSDHGFYSDDLRPEGSSRIRDGQPVAWHRPYGVLAVTGPGIKSDQRVYGASLLDVAPTVLAMLGLPVAEDMDGRPLVQIFEDAVDVATVDTYEDDETPRAAEPEDDPWTARQMLDQLKALGYIEQDDTEGILLDRTRNLGQVYLATGRPTLALEQFGEVLERKPDDKAAKLASASAMLELGRLDEAETLARDVLAGDLDSPQANLHLGIVHFRRGDDEAALERLLAAEAATPELRGLQTRIGQVYMRRQRWEDAHRAFERAIERDDDDADAYDGLGVACRRLGRPGEAVRWHMEAIGRLHYRPQTHAHLGVALLQLGRVRWAKRAFETTLEMTPEHPVAHAGLAAIFGRNPDAAEKAEHHRLRAAASRARLGGEASRAGDTDPGR